MWSKEGLKETIFYSSFLLISWMYFFLPRPFNAIGTILFSYFVSTKIVIPNLEDVWETEYEKLLRLPEYPIMEEWRSFDKCYQYRAKISTLDILSILFILSFFISLEPLFLLITIFTFFYSISLKKELEREEFKWLVRNL